MRQLRRSPFRTLLLAVLAVAAPSAAVATPVSFQTALSGVDWTSAGVAGVGGGSGSIAVSGVSGAIVKAFLYWHGIDNSGTGAVYDNETVSFDGNAVTGVSLGDATTNCWGPGSSRAFRADVTSFVGGNGTYAVSGLSALPGHSANGASLVVVFDDGDGSNDRDLAFFEGNDSDDTGGFPGEDEGWNAILPGITFGGGAVSAQFHTADGQSFPDGSVTFTSDSGSVTIPDSATLWDGNSLPSAGTSRSGSDGLWDIHTVDVAGAFGAPGPYTLTLSGQLSGSDCLGLTVLLIDLEAGSVAGCGDGAVNQESEQCDDGNVADEDGCSALCQIEECGDSVVQAGLGEQCDDGNTADGDGCSSGCLAETEASCGDGAVNQESEECDDGNTTDEDGCSATCQIESCGDDILQPSLGEQCDDGNTADGDGCSAQCEIEECGDGIVQPDAGEQCDDGNTIDGDGCSALCEHEDPCLVECALPGALHVNAANSWLIGTSGDDVLCGDDRANVLRGNGGSDRMCGFGGDDSLYGHLGGADYLDGGADNDILRAEGGDDTVIGGPGNDSLFGHGGNDTIIGGTGNDTIRAGAGNDTVDAGPDTDNINGEGGTDACLNGETQSNCP